MGGEDTPMQGVTHAGKGHTRRKGERQQFLVLLHSAAGAYGTMAAEPTARCIAGGGWVAGLRLTPGLRLGWGIPYWYLVNPPWMSWVLRSSGRGRGCSPGQGERCQGWRAWGAPAAVGCAGAAQPRAM